MSELGKSLRQLVVALGALPEAELRKTRSQILSSQEGGEARELATRLIDLYLEVGEDPEKRASAAAQLLIGIEQAEQEAAKQQGSKGCGASVIFLGVIGIGLVLLL